MEKLTNIIKDFFDDEEVKKTRETQNQNFYKYKNSFCNLECNQNLIFTQKN